MKYKNVTHVIALPDNAALCMDTGNTVVLCKENKAPAEGLLIPVPPERRGEDVDWVSLVSCNQGNVCVDPWTGNAEFVKDQTRVELPQHGRDHIVQPIQLQKPTQARLRRTVEVLANNDSLPVNHWTTVDGGNDVVVTTTATELCAVTLPTKATSYYSCSEE